MSKDNGSGEKKKFCPFLNDYCIEERCALNAELRQVSADGAIRTMSICGFGAMIQMLSEINQKTAPPQPPQRGPAVEIPKIFIGRG